MDTQERLARAFTSRLLAKSGVIILVSSLLLAASQAGNASQQAPRGQESGDKAMTTTNETDLATFQEYEEIKKTLHLYIDNAGSSDGTAMRPAFFDHARIVGEVEGTFYNMTADEFEGAINSDGKSPNIKYNIASIDVSGNAGAAKVEFLNWGGHRFTDFFVLYKHKGVWKISGKVYDAHSKS